MILDFNPHGSTKNEHSHFDPETDEWVSKEVPVRFIGFWRAPELWGHVVEWQKRARLYDRLPWPSDYIDESWGPEERERIAHYLDRGEDVAHWMGYSACRICGERLGTVDQSDGVFQWPAKFSHYLRAHSVRPPAEFIAHVLSILEPKPV